MHFTVEEENLICMYHNADRCRTIGKITAALPDMDGDMRVLAQQTLSKLERICYIIAVPKRGGYNS